MKEKYAISTYKESSGLKDTTVYLKEITDYSDSYIYVEWTENLDEAKLFDTKDEALKYDKLQIGHSIDAYANKGVRINPVLTIIEVYKATRSAGSMYIGYNYRRTR